MWRRGKRLCHLSCLVRDVEGAQGLDGHTDGASVLLDIGQQAGNDAVGICDLALLDDLCNGCLWDGSRGRECGEEEGWQGQEGEEDGLHGVGW